MRALHAHNLRALEPQSKILVTGGAGFIGSALVHELNNRGLHQIHIVDVLGTDAKWRNLVPLTFADYWEASDFQERLHKDAAGLPRWDFIFHLGACSATTERDASYLIQNNYALTRDLCLHAMHAGTRFVYASSAATYGDGSAGMDDQTEDLGRFQPLNMYGYSKHLFDRYALAEGLLEEIVGVKYFNVFGPNEYHKADMRSLVCKAHEQILQTGGMKLFRSHRPDYTDGGQSRDFLYVKDAVAMTIHLAETRSAQGLFNLGSGAARTWLDLAHALFAALGRTPEIEFIDMPESIRDQYQYFTQADITKLRQSGYEAEVTSLEDAVRDYVQNYLNGHRYLGQS
jgi:ADP-L-glycero-D-manno-heptose 6-epimerase